VSLALLTIGALGLGTLGIGGVFVLRTEVALAYQERYAEALSSTPPSENPGYYAETREHRKWVFRLGGAVLAAVGAVLLAVSVYGTLFVESFPR